MCSLIASFASRFLDLATCVGEGDALIEKLAPRQMVSEKFKRLKPSILAGTGPARAPSASEIAPQLAVIEPKAMVQPPPAVAEKPRVARGIAILGAATASIYGGREIIRRAVKLKRKQPVPSRLATDRDALGPPPLIQAEAARKEIAK